MSQTLPLRLVTPVLDDIRDELTAVSDGVDSAQTLLRQGMTVDAGMALAIIHEILFARLPARWWVLTLFEAARKDAAAGPLQELRACLDEVEERLTAAEGAALGGARAANATRLAVSSLSELRGNVALAHQLVDELAEGPLGQQIRFYTLEGLLD